MSVKLSKVLLKVSLLSLVAVIATYASVTMFTQQKNIEPSYHTMTTAALQKEVEYRSINGTLPFPMGLELMKRWSHED